MRRVQRMRCSAVFGDDRRVGFMWRQSDNEFSSYRDAYQIYGEYFIGNQYVDLIAFFEKYFSFDLV